MEQLLDFHGASFNQKVRTTALYLEKKPFQWYRWSVWSKGGPLEWHEFERGLLETYDPSYTTNYAGDLSKLRQEGGSVEDYIGEFMCRSHHVHGLSQDKV